MSQVILDVRERDEFVADHIKNSINIPLSELSVVAPGVLANLANKEVVLICQTGKRAQLAKNQIEAMGVADQCRLQIFEGGIRGWKTAGHGTITAKSSHIPIMRQVLLAAGSLVLIFTLLGFSLSPLWFWGAAAVSLGMIFAGATGICLMAELLGRMPWNR